MHKSATTFFYIFLLFSFPFLLTSCFESTPTVPDPEPPEEKPPPFESIGPVAADGILETVTWNLEWYGHGFGPDNETLQTKNFLRVIDTLNADLYAFEEVFDNQSLSRIVSNMKGYRGFVAKRMSGSQKTAFVYNANIIDSLSSGLIKQNQDAYDWGGGRFPFYFKFNYTTKDTVMTIYAVVIHAKAGADAEDYRRRRDAAQSLYEYLTRNKPDANIIFLGDYNDDVDVSIYNGIDSPYEPFVKDNNSFEVVSMEISKNAQTTYIGYDDAIDHVIISNELFDEYMAGSAKALTKVTEWLGISIDKYDETTTGHYPVWAKFDLRL